MYLPMPILCGYGQVCHLNFSFGLMEVVVHRSVYSSTLASGGRAMPAVSKGSDDSPVKARVIRGGKRKAAAHSIFNSFEHAYVSGLKRKERDDVLSVMKKATAVAEVPLRISVLQSLLPVAIRLSIFESLSVCNCNKYVEWARKAIRLPLGLRCTPAFLNHERTEMAVREAQCVMEKHVSGYDDAKREVMKIVCQYHKAKGGMSGASYSMGLELSLIHI